jgi:cytochrome c-type biogenesis protein CcmH/NrfG
MRLAPASPVVLNNFALASTRLKPKNPEVLQRAEQCMQLALRVAEPKLHSELYDSLGEIRATAGDVAGAIASFEDSIRLNGKGRTKTRRKLIEAYRANGMENMAVAQERIIAQGE